MKATKRRKSTVGNKVPHDRKGGLDVGIAWKLGVKTRSKPTAKGGTAERTRSHSQEPEVKSGDDASEVGRASGNRASESKH